MPNSKVRIISGKWKGRKIEFPGDIVRPSGDRVRETVFNWLQFDIVGTTCLDLFAGSGAFGFEALSRGAKNVVMIDESREVINTLKNSVKVLLADNVEILNAKVPSEKLTQQLSEKDFDIIFIDPPFEKNLVKETISWLTNIPLKKGVLIYVETEKKYNMDFIPENFQLKKELKTGRVQCFLFEVL